MTVGCELLTYSSSGCKPGLNQHKDTGYLSLTDMTMNEFRLAAPLTVSLPLVPIDMHHMSIKILTISSLHVAVY